MDEKPIIRISIRNLVEFILRAGDIDNRHMMSGDQAMAEGSRIHRKIQASRGSNYRAEVSLKFQKDCGRYLLGVEGRADGIEENKRDGISEFTIEEIKGTYRELFRIQEPDQTHLAQAKCYAYLYASQYMVLVMQKKRKIQAQKQAQKQAEKQAEKQVQKSSMLIG